MFCCFVEERITKRRAKTDKPSDGENPWAVAVLEWKARYMVPTRFKIPTAWLRGKLKLEKIPSARPLNKEHVKTLAHSFAMTSTMSSNMTLCFWGVAAQLVEQQLLLTSTPGSPPLGLEYLNHWFGISKELGPIEGQHSFAAVMQLNEKYPKKTVWQSVEPCIIICEGNPNDVHMVHAMGQQSNFKATKFLKPGPVDLVRALHLSYQYQVEYHKGTDVPNEVVSGLKHKWAHYNGIPSNAIGSYWNLARHMGPVWNLVNDIMDGKVKKVKGKDFKIPKSLHHFNGMGGVPDDVLATMLTRVVDSVWSTKDFYAQCGRYKVVMGLRSLILDYLVEKGGLDSETTWAELVTKFPKLTDQFVDTWVPTMSTMTKKQRALPDALRQLLKGMLEVAGVEERTRVSSFFLYKKKGHVLCVQALPSGAGVVQSGRRHDFDTAKLGWPGDGTGL